MIGCENSHNISDHKNEKILAVSRSGIDPNKGTFDWVLVSALWLPFGSQIIIGLNGV